MTSVFAARRRAEEFDSLVENSSTGTNARYDEFLQIVESLRTAPAVSARPEFVADLRSQLMTAADTLLVPGDEARLVLPPRTRSPRERRIAVAVSGIAIVGATTSMAMAAQSALPGDILYPLKRAIENAEAGISVNDGQRGTTLLETASGRLDEVSALTSGDIGGSDAVADTLNTFTEQSIEASDLLLSDYAVTGHESSISELRNFTGDSMDTLAALESAVPVEARDELLHAVSVLTQIDSEAAQACPSCGGIGISEIPAILTSTTTSFGSTGSTDTSSGGAGSTSSGESGSSGSGDEQTTVPETDGNALPPGSVLNPGQTDTSGGDGGGSTDGQQDPITALTDGLTGGGESQPTSNPSGVPGLPDAEAVDETLDEVTDPLTSGDAASKK